MTDSSLDPVPSDGVEQFRVGGVEHLRRAGDVAAPPYHVRDEEARVAALALCALPSPDRVVLTPVAFGPRPGTLWLPAPESAEVTEVPDDTWQGWEWPAGESILLYAQRDPWLPRLYTITTRSRGRTGRSAA